jgi:predicted dehydrogenase
MAEKLGIALVGCGFMGRRHILGYASLHKVGMLDAKIVALMDINGEVAEKVAVEAEQLLGHKPKVYTSLDALLADAEVQAIDIVTEPKTHHNIANTAMNAGRHVLCEKPLALTVKTGMSMVNCAKKNGVVLATAENYRRGGQNRLAKAVIDSGILGKIHLMTEFWAGGDDKVIISKWRHMKNTGAIGMDMSIHYADIIEYMMGEVEHVAGRGIIAEPIRYAKDGSDPVIPDGEDALFATMRTKAGADVQFTYLPSGPGKHYRMRVVHGTNGSVEVPGDRSDGDIFVHLEGRTLKNEEIVKELGSKFALSAVTKAVLGPDGTGGKGAAWADVDSGYLAVEMHDFIEAVLTKRPPEVDGMGGMRALAVVLAILESGVTGKTISVDEILAHTVHSYQDSIDAELEK